MNEADFNSTIVNIMFLLWQFFFFCSDIRVFVTDQEDPETVVDGLNAYSNYTFRVRAVNMYGIGNPSDPSGKYGSVCYQGDPWSSKSIAM